MLGNYDKGSLSVGKAIASLQDIVGHSSRVQGKLKLAHSVTKGLNPLVSSGTIIVSPHKFY